MRRFSRLIGWIDPDRIKFEALAIAQNALDARLIGMDWGSDIAAGIRRPRAERVQGCRSGRHSVCGSQYRQADSKTGHSAGTGRCVDTRESGAQRR